MQAQRTQNIGVKEMLLSRSAQFFPPRFTLKEQTLFVKRFSFLIQSGMPVIECLHILRQQADSKSHTQVLNSLIEDTENGRTLSKSFEKFPRVFDYFAVCIIRVGESTGTLSQNLSYLADELKKRNLLKRKIVGAFIYPIIIILATFGITLFLILYLFPKLLPVFTSLHAELPLSTRIVLGASAFLGRWWIIIICATAFVATFVVVALRRNIQLRFVFDRACLKLPVMGKVIGHYNIAGGSRTLGLLLKSGMPLSLALPLTGETTTNLVYKKEWETLADTVARGEKISAHLETRPDYFPNVFTHLVAVGEKSGTLTETLEYLSDMYDAEVDEFTKNLSTLIEPALMIFMGIVVGFVALSIITPIYSITQNLHA